MVPPEPSTERKILAAVGGAVPRRIIHIQIEKNGALELAACDNSAPDCWFIEPAVKNEFLATLQDPRILELTKSG